MIITKNKKAILQKIWIYIMMSMALVILIVLSVKSVNELKEKQMETNIHVFSKEFEQEIVSLRNKYGSVEFHEFLVGEQFFKICFAEYPFAESTGIEELDVRDMIENGVKKNVFIFSKSKVYTYYFDKIYIENLSETKYGCYNITQGLVDIRMEGRGRGVIIGDSYAYGSYGDCIIKLPDIMNSKKIEPKYWNPDEKYFQVGEDGKIESVCGLGGWQNVQLVQK